MSKQATQSTGWRKCASVTTGGKPHFWYNDRLRYSVTWNRAGGYWEIRDEKEVVILGNRYATDAEAITAANGIAQQPTPPRITPKRYQCDACGHIVTQSTNHYGKTWSYGRVNICPECPPWKKLPEHGGQTTWTCIDTPQP